jgi:formimidoylglutamate deiminase
MLATGALAREVGGRPLVSVGVAPHSIRAVPREWLRPLHELAERLDAPFHMHASEQPAEVVASLDAWGKRPIEVIDAEGALDSRTTVVHATHLTRGEISLLGNSGVTVCACPTTERDLGDGFLPGLELYQAGARIAIGTDSQTVIDPFEDMRLLEYHERLRRLQRVVLMDVERQGRREIAPRLLATGTEGGAAALHLDGGRIAEGALADFIAIDLEHRALTGWRDRTLAAHLALAAPAVVVSDAWVGGVQAIRGGRHRLDAESRAGFERVARRLASRM